MYESVLALQCLQRDSRRSVMPLNSIGLTRRLTGTSIIELVFFCCVFLRLTGRCQSDSMPKLADARVDECVSDKQTEEQEKTAHIKPALNATFFHLNSSPNRRYL